uniref:Type IV pilus assembly protein PilF n=1 Tax=Candidatus Kentrum sp. LPFa TaxID=2126335 RepID=A0A450VSR8_9GAMM|nr:MAG: type IV pilus assembly protein PilF [Candidatus Kentron sp. LPFa]
MSLSRYRDHSRSGGGFGSGLNTESTCWKHVNTTTKTFRSRSYRVRILLLPIFWMLMSCVTGCVTDSRLSSGAIDQETQKRHLAGLHTQLAIAYMEKGDNEFARERLQRALAIEPDYPNAHNALGFLRQRLNQIEKAEWRYRRAIALNPSYSEAYNNLGVLLCMTGRQIDAEGYFLKAIANPGYREPEVAMGNAGDCAYSIGDLKKAETYLRRALSFNIRLPGPLLTMATLSFAKGRALSARKYLRRYFDVATHTARSLWLGMRIEKRLGNRNAVSSYALLLKTHYPDSPEAQRLRELEIHREIHGKVSSYHDLSFFDR